MNRNAPTLLDWSARQHWNNGRTPPCRLCQHPTFMLDESGQPAHKACVELALQNETTVSPRREAGRLV